ncbi:MAG: ABC transporter ATP-binding protein [Flavobacteriales bacterium]
MIRIELQKKLTAAHGTMLLDVVMNIKQGQLVTLYGKSGAGKTSILRMFAGLLQADQGFISIQDKIWLDTQKKINLKPQQRKIGFVFQDYALFPNMTVKENLLFALEKKQDKQIIHELIEMIELGNLQHKKPETLSGGQKQRVALARALVRKPQILMLDEPLSALDIDMRIKLQNYILKVHKQYGLTTLLISHELGEIIKMSDYVFILDGGKIIRQASPFELFTQKKISGKFQFIGEIVQIEKEDILYIITVLIGADFVKIMADEKEIQFIKPGDKVVVASKAFNPLIQKIS